MRGMEWNDRNGEEEAMGPTNKRDDDSSNRRDNKLIDKETNGMCDTTDCMLYTVPVLCKSATNRSNASTAIIAKLDSKSM